MAKQEGHLVTLSSHFHTVQVFSPEDPETARANAEQALGPKWEVSDVSPVELIIKEADCG